MMLLMAEGERLPAVFGPRRLTERQNQIAILIPALLIFSSVGLSQTASPSKVQQRLVVAVNKTLEQGRDAILPPHISHLLGISPDEREVPVKQFAQREEVIKGFDVSTAKREDIVIFVENRSNKESTFYLTSPPGRVRRVVSVQAGVGHDRAPTAEDISAFESEKQFWLDLLAPPRP